jgi:predicted PurR-regulated permease PerM
MVMRIERQLLFWVAAAVVLLGLVSLLREVLLPFVAGTIVAYFLNPVADRLERIGLGRTGAAALVVAAVGVLVVLAAVLVVPLIAGQLRQLIETLPADVAKLKVATEAWLEQTLGGRYPSLVAGLERALADLSQSWAALGATVAKALWSQGVAIVNFVSLLLITPVVVFYLLVDWHAMLDKLDSWLPRDHAGTIRRLAMKINESISAFIRGQGTICIILGILYAAGLTLVGLPYGLLIGVVTGFLAFVPFVGWAAGLLTAGGVAVAEGWPSLLLLAKVIAVFAAGVALDSAVLSPKIVGERIGLHPVWLIFALFVFSYLFGFVGLLVAVPVAAACGVLIRFGLELYLGSSLYRGAAPVDVGNSGGPAT